VPDLTASPSSLVRSAPAPLIPDHVHFRQSGVSVVLATGRGRLPHSAECVPNFPAALVRRLERVRAALGNRMRGRVETGIHLGQGVLNPC
jgi:hypothetical protein